MTDRIIDWQLKCENCGFEFGIMFNADETEENKKENLKIINRPKIEIKVCKSVCKLVCK